MSALRSRTPLAAFAPVLLLGVSFGAVLFMTPQTEQEPREQPVSQILVEGNDETVQRVMVKNSIVEDLLHGVLTWDEALERFLTTILNNEAAVNNLNVFEVEGSLRERVARQLLLFAKVRTQELPSKYSHIYEAILVSARPDVGEYNPTHAQ